MRDLHPEEGSAQRYTVETITLDELTADFQSLDFIKIDVEGNELSVLQGASGLISRHQPTIVVELLRKWMLPFGSHPQDVLRLMGSGGYSCLGITPTGLVPVNLINDETKWTNFVFVHPDRRSHNNVVRDFTAGGSD